MCMCLPARVGKCLVQGDTKDQDLFLFYFILLFYFIFWLNLMPAPNPTDKMRPNIVVFAYFGPSLLLY